MYVVYSIEEMEFKKKNWDIINYNKYEYILVIIFINLII